MLGSAGINDLRDIAGVPTLMPVLQRFARVLKRPIEYFLGSQESGEAESETGTIHAPEPLGQSPQWLSVPSPVKVVQDTRSESERGKTHDATEKTADADPTGREQLLHMLRVHAHALDQIIAFVSAEFGQPAAVPSTPVPKPAVSTRSGRGTGDRKPHR